MRRKAIGTLVAAIMGFLSGGCGGPISAPSAFSEQQFLCDAEHLAEFDRRVEECRQAQTVDGSCKGILSFRGDIDGQDVVVDMRATEVLPDNADGRGLTLQGHAPYFNVRLLIRLDTVMTLDGGIGSSAGGADFIDLEARGGNYLTRLASKTVDVQLDSAAETRLFFNAVLSRGGNIDGCFDAFAGVDMP